MSFVASVVLVLTLQATLIYYIHRSFSHFAKEYQNKTLRLEIGKRCCGMEGKYFNMVGWKRYEEGREIQVNSS